MPTIDWAASLLMYLLWHNEGTSVGEQADYTKHSIAALLLCMLLFALCVLALCMHPHAFRIHGQLACKLDGWWLHCVHD